MSLLQASDPSKYDLLKKNHLLQKRLVAATQRLAASEGEVMTLTVSSLKFILENSNTTCIISTSPQNFCSLLNSLLNNTTYQMQCNFENMNIMVYVRIEFMSLSAHDIRV